MALLLISRPGYPIRQRSANPQVDDQFQVMGTEDREEAYAFALQEIPEVQDALSINDLKQRPLAKQLWEFDAIYRVDKVPSAENDPTFDWAINATEERISQALAVVSQNVAPGYTAKPTTGALGLTRDGEVQGITIPRGREQFTFTLWKPEPLFTRKLRAYWRTYIGSSNNAPWKDYVQGEVCLESIHVTGKAQEGEDNLLQIQFGFAVRGSLLYDETKPNETGFKVYGSDIPRFTKEGWDHVEFDFAEELDDATGLTLSKPVQANVYRTVPRMDYSKLGLGK